MSYARRVVRKCCNTYRGTDPHDAGCPHANGDGGRPVRNWRDALKRIQARHPEWKEATMSDRPRASRGPFVPITINRVIAVTAKAALLETDEGEAWVPFSQMEDPDEVDWGREDFELSMTEWIAKEKEWL